MEKRRNEGMEDKQTERTKERRKGHERKQEREMMRNETKEERRREEQAEKCIPSESEVTKENGLITSRLRWLKAFSQFVDFPTFEQEHELQ